MKELYNKIKGYLRYTWFHYLILKFKNPLYINLIKKDVQFHKKFLANDELIFDLGANRGEKSNIFSYFTKRIILYEPEQTLYKLLKLRFRKNKNIVINNLVVSDKCGEILFYSMPENEAYSSIVKDYNKNFVHLQKSDVVVEKKISTTLNAEIKKFGIPSYIKIDCEGSEKLILKSLDYKIKKISFEANLPNFLNETLDIIDIFKNKFNSSFNLRRNNEFEFCYSSNINSLKLKNFLLSEKDTYEIFIFNE